MQATDELAVASGDAAALRALFARVYAELKQMAHHHLAASSGHTLNTTGLVHEVYLKLAQPEGRDLHGRAHFFALAAKAMRQIVIDHARARMTDKRGGAGLQIVTLDAAMVSSTANWARTSCCVWTSPSTS